MSKRYCGVDFGSAKDYTAWCVARTPYWWERLLMKLGVMKRWERKIITLSYDEAGVFTPEMEEALEAISNQWKVRRKRGTDAQE